MEISCPHCGFAREVNPDQVPDRPVKVTCPRCREAFRFDRNSAPPPGGQEATATSAAAPANRDGNLTVCPACGFEQPAGEACQGCGIIFAKWQARQQTLREMNEEPKPVLPNTEAAGFQPGLRPQAKNLPAAAQPKAGFWIRFVAYFIDGAIVFVVQLVLGFLLGLILGMSTSMTHEGQTATSIVSGLLGAAISFAYGVFFIGYCGQTPGKMALRIKVIRTDGAEMTYGRAVLREILGKFVSAILLGIGYLMIAFDSQKQGLHDKIADTYVIKL